MQRDNVTFKHGALWELRCRGCATVIGSHIPDDGHRETKVINGKPIVFERLIFARHANYREVLMDCDGGAGGDYRPSAHVACMCVKCAEAATVEQLQAHHDLDMEELGLHKEGRTVNGAREVALHISAV